MSMLEIVLSVALTAVLLREAIRSSKRRRRRRLGAESEAAIPEMSVTDLDPAFRVGPLGPDRERTEVVFLGGGNVLVPASTTDYEAWILAVLAKDAKRMFEFGTCTGRTTYLWARNSPPAARITTITLAADHVGEYVVDARDDAVDHDIAVDESTFEEFLLPYSRKKEEQEGKAGGHFRNGATHECSLSD